MTARSGTTLTYAQRKAGRRPVVTLTPAAETLTRLAALASRLGLSRSAVVDLAVAELAKRYPDRDVG